MRKAIRIDALRDKLGGCSAATVWRRVADGTIPKPAKIGGMSVWDESEIDAVIEMALLKREPEAA